MHFATQWERLTHRPHQPVQTPLLKKRKKEKNSTNYKPKLITINYITTCTTLMLSVIWALINKMGVRRPSSIQSACAWEARPPFPAALSDNSLPAAATRIHSISTSMLLMIGCWLVAIDRMLLMLEKNLAYLSSGSNWAY